jgi:hypothetical protein
VLRRIIAGCIALAGSVSTAVAQSGNSEVGANGEFVFPLGARAMGMGQAVVASSLGAESVWWNPAFIARAPREFLVGSVSGMPIAESDLNTVGVYSIPRVISFALGLRYVNYGQQDAGTDPNITTGTIRNSASILGATFAAPFGNRLSVGTTLKVLTIGFDCTGTCPNQPQSNPVTGAVDFGIEYMARRDSTITVGAALRNIGSKLQFNDSPQADPLPGRIDVGVEVAPRLAQYPGLGVRLSTDVVTRTAHDFGPGFRFGGEVSWLNQYFARGGYVLNGPTGSGPSIGGGLAAGRWRIDFAQFLSDVSAESGLKPTYVSLRYSF